MTNRDFGVVAEVFHDSRAYRAVHGTIARVSVAAAGSRLLRRWRMSAEAFNAISARRRLETCAIAIAVASIAHLAMREVLPRYATSGLPWWWNVAVAVGAVMVAALAAPLSTAWAESSPARLWRRFTA